MARAGSGNYVGRKGKRGIKDHTQITHRGSKWKGENGRRYTRGVKGEKFGLGVVQEEVPRGCPRGDFGEDGWKEGGMS